MQLNGVTLTKCNPLTKYKIAKDSSIQLLFVQRDDLCGCHFPLSLHVSCGFPLRRYLSLQTYLIVEPTL